jgi:hypothetical protein
MSGERWALRAGEYLVRRACRSLPARVREERYREWVAELPVMLHDPEVRPTARRVAHMLCFAADTLRGTTLAPGSYRYRGAHQGRADWDVLWLPVFAAMLAFLGYFVYLMIFGPSLGRDTALWSFFLTDFIVYLARRRPDEATGRRWWTAGGLAVSTGQLAQGLADSLGWGHPLLFALIRYCGAAISVVCLGLAVALWARSVRARRRVGRP